MMVKKMHESDSENEIREAYRVFDKERTGFIAVSEMRLILSNLPEKLSEVRGLGRSTIGVDNLRLRVIRVQLPKVSWALAGAFFEQLDS